MDNTNVFSFFCCIFKLVKKVIYFPPSVKNAQPITTQLNWTFWSAVYSEHTAIGVELWVLLCMMSYPSLTMFLSEFCVFSRMAIFHTSPLNGILEMTQRKNLNFEEKFADFFFICFCKQLILFKINNWALFCFPWVKYILLASL